MIIRFEKGGTLRHFEKVQDMQESSNGILVTTDKKIWRLDRLFDGRI